MDFTAGCHHVRRKTLMVFDVTRSNVGCATFKLIKQIDGVFAEDIHQHIQPTTMRHADANFLGTIAADALNGLGHHRDQALTTLETKALGARIL